MNILGVRVSARSFDETVNLVLNWAQEPTGPPEPRTVFATSVHGLSEASHDASLRAVLNGGALVVPDGLPLVWFGRLRGNRAMQQVRGTELLEEVCRRSAPFGLRHYFYGSAPGVAEALARKMAARFPGLVVAGWESPPFRALTREEFQATADQINATRPDLVWVGLGTPKQERWVATMQPLLRCRVVLSVGAAFDFHTGRRREAPRLVRHIGLEWAWRLMHEPRRLGPRYLRHNPRFVLLALAQLVHLLEPDDPDK